jgi:multidrug resistance efflux pump
MASWCYSLLFLGLMLWGAFRLLGTGGNLLPAVAVALMGSLGVRSLLKGVSQGEAMNMLRTRHKRTIGWLLLGGAVAAGLFLIEVEDRVGGTFQLRPVMRAEVRAPAAAFLKDVHVDEGDDVSQGAGVALLEIPELSSRIAQKQGEMQEVAAQLRLLEIGARPEQIAEQRRKVERATAWRDLARRDLARSRNIFDHELTALEKQAAVREAELAFADDGLKRVETLQLRGAVSEQDRMTAEHRQQIARAQHDHARAERGAREAEGTLDFETELARREKDLAQTEGELALLEAGSRPEEIESQRARLARLDEELRYLRELQNKVRVQSPLAGRVTTPRLREKTGQYLKEGDLICLIEDTTSLDAEIALSEEDAARVVAGSRCRLKTRALPYDSLEGSVAQIALAATPPCTPGAAGTAGAAATALVRDAPGTILVRCRLELTPGGLRPGMSGYARVYGAHRPIGLIALDRALRFVRTEFWW